MRNILWMLLAAASLWGISNEEVAKRTDAAMSGYGDAEATMQMTLINAGGEERVREMTLRSLEREGGDKSLMEFLSPADVKGTKFLSYEHADRDDDQWLYLPALKRVKRIASKNKSGSFMGSEFSYEDLTAFNIDKYRYAGEAEEVRVDGKAMLKTVRIPVSEDSGYTKEIAWVDPSTWLTMRVDYYDRKHERLKTADFSGYHKIDGVWRIGQIAMTNHQNDKKTIMIWTNETIHNGLDDNDFHTRVLH